MKPVIIIPARYQSSRLPGKPLADIVGKSMIQRTYEKCIDVLPDQDVYVATDDTTIQEHCQELGMNVVMTSSNCLTGTDRIAQAAEAIDCDVVINVQGDEPIINPEDIQQVIDAVMDYPGEIINGMATIDSEQEFRNPSIPKVVTRSDGRLLYMSRNAIPTTKTLNFESAWRQICIYAFPIECLARFTSQTEKTVIEKIEDIEILRFLEMGYDVRMVQLSGSSYAVDTPDDLEKVRNIIKEQ
jgi:3-deoxy-manno-octulosonate cytidylyltransferase (CMP-KDO synthetase)